MYPTKKAQKQMQLAQAAQDDPARRFTDLYSLMHWDYWIDVPHVQSWRDRVAPPRAWTARRATTSRRPTRRRWRLSSGA